jgi:hypothetical protein
VRVPAKAELLVLLCLDCGLRLKACWAGEKLTRTTAVPDDSWRAGRGQLVGQKEIWSAMNNLSIQKAKVSTRDLLFALCSCGFRVHCILKFSTTYRGASFRSTQNSDVQSIRIPEIQNVCPYVSRGRQLPLSVNYPVEWAGGLTSKLNNPFPKGYLLTLFAVPVLGFSQRVNRWSITRGFSHFRPLGARRGQMQIGVVFVSSLSR